MRFKEGDKVEFIYRNKKSVGEINGVYPGTQEVSIKQSDSPVDLLFSDKAVAKVEEPELVVVPQCVADWYEQHRYKLEHSIWQYIYCWDVQKRKSDFYNFMKNDNLKPVETLIRMRYGYEVEKEPVWVVENENGYRLRSITMNPGNSLNWSFDSKNKNYIEFEEFETAKKAAYLVTGNVTEI
ncbi:TPA: DUF1642 domain-containing protein [Listeria monocytogenes]|uniref:DUF1642 domain-containing protein n=1 Tax=Listeria monocytogenes TaxID=1639 RepID=UPI0009A4E06E|nr:DUF1642 domain-containing protein [Listeria monocytogenes]EAE3135971.1 DUF1642 domain-containing protein [Listeria monocytogenes]EAE4236071.1 DUF1642 domain-containing protein [Listeria monocytogenes]EAE4805929.1 DUF1642 domain-containing protein [Listeria monocytogenes]EAE4949398.1 DUF1642 domain-containing protein [Listeria monocytogenes]EAF2651211.1 DUF1642 domain-containing protein [Listeria monocytogenes]